MKFLFSRKIYLPLCFTVALIGFSFYEGRYYGTQSLNMPIAISIVFFFFVVNERIVYMGKKRDFLEPDFVFFILFIIFHFSYIWLYYFGISDYDPEVFYNRQMVLKAVYFCIFCIIGFLLGYGRPYGLPINLNGKDNRNFVENVFIFSKALIVLCLLFFWMPLLSLGTGVFSDYKLLTSVGTTSRFGKFFWLGQYLGVTALSLYCISSGYLYKQYMTGRFRYLAVFYIIGYLLIGDRGGFVFFAIIPALAYNLYQRPISGKLFSFIIGCLLLVSSVVAFSRTEVVFNPLEMYLIYSQRTTTSPLVHSFNEFGSSLKTVTIAMHFVPQQYDYWWGKSYLYAMSLVLPNLSEMRVSAGSPGAWLTETAFGDLDETYGRGGSIAMDAYLNFGFVGGVATFIFLGYVVKRIFLYFMTENTVISAVFYFSVMSALALWIRNTSSIAPRTIVWSLLIVYFLKHHYLNNSSKSSIKSFN